jgi:long-chain acyl-CoA synthetase
LSAQEDEVCRVREYSTPLGVEISTIRNLTDDVVSNAASHPADVCFSRKMGEGWRPVTAAEFLDDVCAAAKGFIAAGIQAGDRVAILSKTRYEWTVLDYAIWFAGAVSVPIYDSASVEEIHWILTDSGARGIVGETSQHVSDIEASRVVDGRLEHVWCIEEQAIEALTTIGTDVADGEVERRRNALSGHSTATLIYTSGTTGKPKGCMLTHANFNFEVSSAIDGLKELFEGDGASTLLFLPLPHVFARIIQVGAIRARVRLGHSSHINSLHADLVTFQPTFVLGVPRIFEKLFNLASQEAAIQGSQKVFDRAVRAAIAYSRALDYGRVGPILRARRAVFDRLVYRKLRRSMGERCRYAVSGGAPLGERLGHFYRGSGIPVLEGYGLSETTGAVTVNLPHAMKIGTAGRPIAGTSIRVAEDGALMVHGGQVFAGYWRDEQATAAALSDSDWLRTGDLGEIDDEGFVRITGRKDEMIVTAGGKNVSPTILEDRVREHPLVSHCLVVGDGRPYIGALITIDRETLAGWLEQQGKSGDLVDLVADRELIDEVQTSIDHANAAVSKAEAIRRFTILPTEWTEGAGQLTPSLKVKRNVLVRELREPIDALYSV